MGEEAHSSMDASGTPVLRRRISRSLLAAVLVCLTIAIADTIVVGGFGLGTLWGLVMAIVFFGALWWEWEKADG